MTLLHATGLVFEGKGVILRGPSGVGKSDLALRLMARGGELVGDDYLEISCPDRGAYAGRPVMRGPQTISGKIEVRAVGVLSVPVRLEAPVDMVFNLMPPTTASALVRLPEEESYLLEGVEVPCLDFNGLEASAPEKLSAALKIFT